MEQFAPLLLERFGKDWLKRGTLSVYFRNATLSGQPVRAFLAPADKGSGASQLEMRDEAGRIVCEGHACLGQPLEPTPLRQRLVSSVDGTPGPLLAGLHIGRRARRVPSRIAMERFRQDVAGVTAPIAAYAEGALPANLSIDVLRAVEPHLVSLPAGCVGLYGGIELQLLEGPLRADTVYHCDGEVLAAGQTPRTETLWYSAEAYEQDRLVARMLMLSRIMPLRRMRNWT